jgi:hypothetical protein
VTARFAIVFGVALVLVLVVRELRQPGAPEAPARVNGVVPNQPAPHPPGRPMRTQPVKLPAPIASQSAPSAVRNYVPQGFDANFRQRIVADLGRDIDTKLGQGFPMARRVQIAEVQNQFWDVHGPDVDLLREGKIDQPEFALRTRNATAQYQEGMAAALSDEDYEKLFDFPKGADFFSILYHSPTEQPGMSMKDHQQAPPTMNGPSRPVPHPTGPTGPTLPAAERPAKG